MSEYKIHHSTYDLDSLLPEQKARVKIDQMLKDSGWTVVSRDDFTPDAVNAQAVEENLMKGNLEADYILYLDGKAIAVLEAKREENKLGLEVAEQAQMPANDLQALEQAVADHKVAGIMLECVQGEGGVNPLTTQFVKFAERIAKEQDIPLIIDEVQTGNGRTGKLYGYMNFDIQPDIVSTAKGLGGGLPIGATMMGQKVQDVLKPGDHGSTYGGNPVSCAGALSVISRMDDNFLNAVRRKSGYVFSTLYNAPGIESVSGMGLMVGIKTVKPAKEVVAACMEKGVLCLTAKDKVRLLPALNIPMDQLSDAIEIIKAVCAE